MSGGRKKPFDPDARVVDLDEWRITALIGECMLDQAKRDPAFKAELLDRLDRMLTDPDDRARFGLARTPPPAL